MNNVLIATRIYDPEPAAASFRLKTLAEELTRAGYGVDVFTSAYRDAPQHETTPSGVTVHRAPVLRGKDGYMRGYLQYLSFDVPLFFRLLARKNVDLYISEPPPTTGIITALVATLKRRPYVYYAADVWSDAAAGAGVPRMVCGALRAVESLALHRADRVFAVSEGVERRVRSLGARDVTVVRNGINTEVFRLEGKRVAIEGARYFVYAGTMSEWQGAEIFVQALERIHADYPDVHIIFLGQGSAVNAIKETAQSLRLTDHIHIEDAVSPDKAAEYQRGAVAALVSIRPGADYDFAYPTKTLAAWACGIPAIYAGVGPAKNDIEDYGLGWALDFNAHDIAGAMVQALEHPLDSQAIAQWAHNHVSFARRMQPAVTVINELLHTPSRRCKSVRCHGFLKRRAD
ncbi:MAG: glycosyltransferase family 4 protein [Actinomycetaceae bacterium]|nr:glycosyltransferase family 4 protein [Actinomycetaceae bacterium]MDY5273909.1 glycosyltransferase family 4 protein [Arcanobacterium sp.]